jgi:hypothetical protein
VWFIDAQIAWDQFDNPLFHTLCRSLSPSDGARIAATSTIVRSILPLLYRYAIDAMRAIISKWKGYWSTYDGWSKFGHSFVSQNYHGINPKAFKFDILLLDLIYMPFPKYAESLAGQLEFRQDIHTSGMDPMPIRAGGVADQASNMQGAGKLICMGTLISGNANVMLLVLCLMTLRRRMDWNSMLTLLRWLLLLCM